MSLVKFVKMDSFKDIVHTSGYAKAQSGGNIGAAGATLFSERQKIEQNRKFVRGYKNSKVISDHLPARGSFRVVVPQEQNATGGQALGQRQQMAERAMTRAKQSSTSRPTLSMTRPAGYK